MALSQSTLKNELVTNLSEFKTELEAINAWGDSFKNFFVEATCAGSVLVPIALEVPITAMKGAMLGLSTTGAAAIQAGLNAFWVSMQANVSTVFPGMTLPVTPPGTLATTQTALEAAFLTNTNSKAPKDVALDAIATIIYTNTQGASVTNPVGPVVVPIL